MAQVAANVGVAGKTVRAVDRRYEEGGLDSALYERRTTSIRLIDKITNFVHLDGRPQVEALSCCGFRSMWSTVSVSCGWRFCWRWTAIPAKGARYTGSNQKCYASQTESWTTSSGITGSLGPESAVR